MDTQKLEEIEEKGRRFERIMLAIIGIASVIAAAIMFLLPDTTGLGATGKAKEIIIVILAWSIWRLFQTL